MKIIAHLGNRAHAPADSKAALISAYTAGADLLYLAVRATADGHVVLADEDDVAGATGASGRISETKLVDLRLLDFSETFNARDTAPGAFHYYDPAVTGRRLEIETLEDALLWLPHDVDRIVEARGAGAAGKDLADRVRQMVGERRQSGRTILAADSAALLARFRLEQAGQRTAFVARAPGPPPASDADLLIIGLDRLWHDGGWTDEAAALAQRRADGEWPLGLCALAGGDRLDAATIDALWASERLWGMAAPSVLDFAHRRPGYRHTADSFAGDKVDRTRFALGYAKANKFASVTWNDGVHLDIAPYDGPMPEWHSDPIELRLSRLEWDLINVAKEWPYYSGGGLGVTRGIAGDFAAEVSYEVARVGQATTLEMAVLNVDPGSHRGTPPVSFRDKDSFYDPHGAPPYVGVEHDEDDGFRINWNLGSEYDNNQYGRPVGDGRTPRGARLRLERRGAFFSAYYRKPRDEAGAALPPADWVCVGVTINHTLNAIVHLRCVGKRWRQEKESDPSQHEAIIANRFTFRDLEIRCFPNDEGD